MGDRASLSSCEYFDTKYHEIEIFQYLETIAFPSPVDRSPSARHVRRQVLFHAQGSKFAGLKEEALNCVRLILT